MLIVVERHCLVSFSGFSANKEILPVVPSGVLR